MIDNLVDLYLNKSTQGHALAGCIDACNRYGPIEYEKNCNSTAIKTFFNGPHGEFMFGPVDRNANFYMNYRDLIDQRQIFPYKISDNCFVDKYRRCNGEKNMCQICALEQCKGPPMISESYPF